MQDYIDDLSPEKKEIIDDLNKDEKDALLITAYKRGPERVREDLDEQLDNMLEKRSRQKKNKIFEGYKAC